MEKNLKTIFSVIFFVMLIVGVFYAIKVVSWWEGIKGDFLERIENTRMEAQEGASMFYNDLKGRQLASANENSNKTSNDVKSDYVYFVRLEAVVKDTNKDFYFSISETASTITFDLQEYLQGLEYNGLPLVPISMNKEAAAYIKDYIFKFLFNEILSSYMKSQNLDLINIGLDGYVYNEKTNVMYTLDGLWSNRK